MVGLIYSGKLDPAVLATLAAATRCYAAAVLGLGLVLARLLVIVRRPRPIIAIVLVPVNAGLNAVLIGPLGLPGIALATALTATLQALAYLLVLRQAGWRGLLGGRRGVAELAIVTGATVVAVVLLGRLPLGPPVRLALRYGRRRFLALRLAALLVLVRRGRQGRLASSSWPARVTELAVVTRSRRARRTCGARTWQQPGGRRCPTIGEGTLDGRKGALPSTS